VRAGRGEEEKAFTYNSIIEEKGRVGGRTEGRGKRKKNQNTFWGTGTHGGAT